MLTSDGSVLIGALMGAISLLYATAGQAGGTAFLAVMAVASFNDPLARIWWLSGVPRLAFLDVGQCGVPSHRRSIS